MEELFFILLALASTAFVTRPWWGGGTQTVTEDPAVAALEAARDSKFREIRDAETDLATGKLSQADYDAVNRELRSDAGELIAQLDRAKDHTTTDNG